MASNISVNNNNSKSRILYGACVGSASSTLMNLLYNRTLNGYLANKTTSQTTENLTKYIDKAFENPKFASWKFLDVYSGMPKESYDKCHKLLYQEIPKCLEDIPFGKKIVNRIVKNTAKKVISCENALTLLNTKGIVMNKEKLGAAAFHEMGHALNNCSKATRALQIYGRPLSIVANLFSGIALLTNKRPNGDNTRWQKFTTFVKNNVGKLVTLSFLPVILEEILASARGHKLAKEVLPKQLMKSVIKTHCYGASTYIGTAIMAGFTAFIANKIRDKIVHK